MKLKLKQLIQSLVAKYTNANANTCKPTGVKSPRTKRDYTLRRAQNRRNTQGASAKGNVPGRKGE